MIDMNKQYTYNGKPVRIYANGNDCSMGKTHGAYQNQEGGTWYIKEFSKQDLVEVWQPKEGEIVWCWDDDSAIPALRKYDKCRAIWNHYAPFIGTLPKAFKGL